MSSNKFPRNNSDIEMINSDNNNCQNTQYQKMKKYWCHLCKKEFPHEEENIDVKCSFCNETFCEIIENEDMSNPAHPSHFEPFDINNTNSSNNNNNSQVSLNNLPNLRKIVNILRMIDTINFLDTFTNSRQNPNDNLDDIINHLMQNDPNKYGNPPAAKQAVEKLKKCKINEEKIKEFGIENSCAVCKDEFNIGEECLSMPCNHYFHINCLIPWLNERNSCPICRYELPTDDKDFEEMKKIKMKNENNNINNTNQNVQG